MMKGRVRLLTTFLSLFVLASIIFTGCEASGSPNSDAASQVKITSAETCPLTESVRIKPPDDAAVQGSSDYGYYFANEDRSILASAWWTEEEAYHLQAGEKGNKVGWFRPEGADLEITGQRLDAQAPPLEAHVPCCYPTRFQATGLIFPTEGCWQVAAQAADRELSFVTWVKP